MSNVHLTFQIHIPFWLVNVISLSQTVLFTSVEKHIDYFQSDLSARGAGRAHDVILYNGLTRTQYSC